MKKKSKIFKKTLFVLSSAVYCRLQSPGKIMHFSSVSMHGESYPAPVALYIWLTFLDFSSYCTYLYIYKNI